MSTSDAVLTAIAMISEPGDRVLLSDVRSAVLADRADVDAALLSLQREGRIVLMGCDNPLEITPSVKAAELMICGCARHLLYVIR